MTRDLTASVSGSELFAAARGIQIMAVQGLRLT